MAFPLRVGGLVPPNSTQLFLAKRFSDKGVREGGTVDDDGADISWIICILQTVIQVFVSTQ